MRVQNARLAGRSAGRAPGRAFLFIMALIYAGPGHARALGRVTAGTPAGRPGHGPGQGSPRAPRRVDPRKDQDERRSHSNSIPNMSPRQVGFNCRTEPTRSQSPAKRCCPICNRVNRVHGAPLYIGLSTGCVADRGRPAAVHRAPLDVRKGSFCGMGPDHTVVIRLAPKFKLSKKYLSIVSQRVETRTEIKQAGK